MSNTMKGGFLRDDTGALIISGISEATPATNASAVTFAPTGTISSTDVQAAIAEVAAEAAGGALDPDLTAIAALTPANDDIIQRKAGAWTNRTVAQVKTDLAITKTDLGLANVDNTSDANKPISSATTTALAGKQPLDSDLTDIAALAPANDSFIQRKGGVWVPRTMAQLKTDLALTSADVGLGSVNNTADTAKPISTATQTALDAKQPLDSDLTALAAIAPANDDVLQRKAGAWTNRTPAQLKTDLALAKADVGLSNVDNTSDAAKPVSTATQTALDAKQPLDAELTALAALTSAANTFPYFTGSGTAALAPISAFGQSFVNSADAAAALVTLGTTPVVGLTRMAADAMVNPSANTAFFIYVPSLAQDTFVNRTDTNGWGVAEKGGTYVHTGGGVIGDWSTSANVARVTMGTANLDKIAHLPISELTSDRMCLFSFDEMPTGAAYSFFMLLRSDGTNNWYRAWVTINTTGSVTITLSKNIATVTSDVQASVTVSGLTFTAGKRLWLRARTTGASPTTFEAKVWEYGTAEPASFQRSATDSTAPLQVAGQVGWHFRTGVGNTNVPCTGLLYEHGESV